MLNGIGEFNKAASVAYEELTVLEKSNLVEEMSAKKNGMSLKDIQGRMYSRKFRKKFVNYCCNEMLCDFSLI